MERDRNISKLVRESGLNPAPEEFTGEVMRKIDPQGQETSYKPLIGRGALVGILLLIAFVVAALLINPKSGRGSRGVSEIFQSQGWNLSVSDLDLTFISSGNYMTWLAPTLAAIFLLVLYDAGFFRRKAT